MSDDRICDMCQEKIIQLQPCPFCNGSVIYRFFQPDAPGEYEPQHNFICNGCEVLVVLVDVSKEEAITIYNNRPDRAKRKKDSLWAQFQGTGMSYDVFNVLYEADVQTAEIDKWLAEQ